MALDYLHAPSYGDNDVLVAGGVAQSFPQNWSKLDSVRLDLRYRWTTTVQMHLRYVHESYNSNDWALDQVGPATIPNVLSLGLQPYQHNVNVVALTVRVQFRTAVAATPTTE